MNALKEKHAEKTAKYFDSRANVYEKGWAKDKKFPKAILEFAEFKGDEVVLEAGIGSGAMAREVAPFVKEVYGLDVSKGMLEKAAAHLPRHRLIVGDVQALPFLDESFDVVYCRSLTMHIDSPQKFYDEAFRVLKKGGKGLIVETSAKSRATANFMVEMGNSKEENPTHTNCATVDELRAQLESAGFKDLVGTIYEQPFSVKQWLEGQPLTPELKENALHVVRSAPAEAKRGMGFEGEGEDARFNITWALFKGLK